MLHFIFHHTPYTPLAPPHLFSCTLYILLDFSYFGSVTSHNNKFISTTNFCNIVIMIIVNVFSMRLVACHRQCGVAIKILLLLLLLFIRLCVAMYCALDLDWIGWHLMVVWLLVQFKMVVFNSILI